MKQLLLGLVAVVCVEESVLEALLANERNRQACLARGGVVVETDDTITCMAPPVVPQVDEEA